MFVQKNLKKYLIIIAVLFCVSVNSIAKSEVSFNLEKVSSGLNIPWGMTFISENEILFTQKDGYIGILNTKTKNILKVKNSLKVKHDGQGGLLDIITSPDFKSTAFIYLTYVKDTNKGAVTALARAKLVKNTLVNLKDVLVTKSFSKTSRHFGSRITFDEKGHLFFSIGDRGVRANAQDLTNHAGTILRLNLDGSIPKDNPFVNTRNALPEIYSYGHRNPQGLFYDKTSKKLWSIEHGPRGGDEINLIKKGVNYGWPVISYGKEYWSISSVGEGTHKAGMQQPVKVYTPSIAPSSLIVYSGNKFPLWRGDIFSGALKLQHINQIKLDKNNNQIYEKRLVDTLNERIRALTQSPRGYIYFSTDDGNIYKVLPK